MGSLVWIRTRKRLPFQDVGRILTVYILSFLVPHTMAMGFTTGETISGKKVANVNLSLASPIKLKLLPPLEKSKINPGSVSFKNNESNVNNGIVQGKAGHEENQYQEASQPLRNQLVKLSGIKFKGRGAFEVEGSMFIIQRPSKVTYCKATFSLPLSALRSSQLEYSI